MDNEMSLDEQIQRMYEMRGKLEDFCIIMRTTMEGLQNDIKFLRSQGFSIETENRYTQHYYASANTQVETVVNHIQNMHFNYIDSVIESLKKARDQE